MLGSVGSVEIFEAFNVAIKGVRSWLLGSICNKSISGRIFPSPSGALGAVLFCAFCRLAAVCRSVAMGISGCRIPSES